MVSKKLMLWRCKGDYYDFVIINVHFKTKLVLELFYPIQVLNSCTFSLATITSSSL